VAIVLFSTAILLFTFQNVKYLLLFWISLMSIKLKVFISSVQSKFAEERQMLFEYLMQNALPGLFFKPFIFNSYAKNLEADI